MRRRGKVDGNHAEIVDALRKCGWRVVSLAALGNGVPDLLIYRPVGGMRLVEVKSRKGRLTEDQRAFWAWWPTAIVRSVDEALNL